MRIKLLITGRMYHAAAPLPAELELPEGAELADALAAVVRLAGDAPLPDSCLVAVGGQHVGTLKSHRPCPLSDGDELTMIAPVAGG